MDEMAITKHSLRTKDNQLILKWGEGGILRVDLGGQAAGTLAKAWTKTGLDGQRNILGW